MQTFIRHYLDQGYTHNASGATGNVFIAADHSHVIKISTHRANHVFAEYCARHPQRHLPKIIAFGLLTKPPYDLAKQKGVGTTTEFLEPIAGAEKVALQAWLSAAQAALIASAQGNAQALESLADHEGLKELVIAL